MAHMKKRKSGKRGSSAKGKGAAKSVAAYLAGVPEPARSTLKKMRAAIRAAAPAEATEIISYGIPAFKHNGSAGVVCGVCEALQFVSDRFGDRSI